MRDDLKRTGKVGGTYYVKTDDIAVLNKKLKKAQQRGGGGDGPENNVEAVLYGLSKNPAITEVIMIADNWATPRDLELLRRVRKPIHVIVCGSSIRVNPEYLNLARSTGGSVHTMEEDLTNLARLHEGQSITISGVKYKIKSGKFVASGLY